MEIRVVKYFGPAPHGVASAQLRTDDWDDFGWRTMFDVRLFLTDGTSADLGRVKVLRVAATKPERTALDSPTSDLGPAFCSLGQRLSYYETLAALEKREAGISDTYLDAMRDVAVHPNLAEQYGNHEGFKTSFLRENTAAVALREARGVFGDGDVSATPGELEFGFDLPGNDQPLHFRFGDGQGLPDRIHAVIGYNGVGKTRLLANIGMVAATPEAHRLATETVETYGRFTETQPSISAVICVSYSAFDDFPFPGSRVDDESGRGALGMSYTYCGLRKRWSDLQPEDEDGVRSDADESLLKSIEEIAAEFLERRAEAVKLRPEQLEGIFRPVFSEPSFRKQGPLPALDARKTEWKRALRNLSTGHKIVLNILMHLCAKLEKRSLVLLDEPEMHLHPPLIAALLSSIQKALLENDSFAIVATHSPVVAQEIPGQHVAILRRARSRSVVDAPEIETFGEDISLLTSRIFNLDNSESDFRRTLLRLAADHSLDYIEDLFEGGLSSQGRMTVLAEQARLAE